jgi:hypothetical protein
MQGHDKRDTHIAVGVSRQLSSWRLDSDPIFVNSAVRLSRDKELLHKKGKGNLSVAVSGTTLHISWVKSSIRVFYSSVSQPMVRGPLVVREDGADGPQT